MKEKRLTRIKTLIRRFATSGLDHVLFSDAKLFIVEEVSNRKNDRILSSIASLIPEKYRFVTRVQEPFSVMVLAGISKKSRTPLVFVPFGVKINQKTYQDLILKPIVKDLGKSTVFNNAPFLFQQDGAPAHTAKTTQEWLRTQIPDFINKEEWPPSSPDLNPLDFSLWSILETKVCCKSHTNFESLKQSLSREWYQIPQETLRMTIEAVLTRLRAVIKEKGGYIERAL